MSKPLTVTFYVGNKQVDKLTDAQLERMSQKLSEAMSLYYTAHPDEYLKLQDTPKCSRVEKEKEKCYEKDI